MENDIEKFFNEMLIDSINKNCSDIHIKPQKERSIIKLRINGKLQDYITIENSIYKNLVSYIKLKNNMDISEKRIPQDGRMTFDFNSRDIDIRTSSVPTIFGEKLALRILNRSNFLKDKKDLGFLQRDIKIIENLLKQKSGMILISGSTGSGKTTTAYSLINDLIDKNLNIISIEDPIEYRIDEITQIQVNKKIGIDFDNGLKSILRQDPDVIFVGEIRDLETAKTAIKASTTGHLVISTIHTNDSLSSLLRFIEMNIPHYLINASLIGIISQRLITINEKINLSYEILEVKNSLKKYINNDIDYSTLRSKAKELNLISSNKDIFENNKLMLEGAK